MNILKGNISKAILGMKKNGYLECTPKLGSISDLMLKIIDSNYSVETYDYFYSCDAIVYKKPNEAKIVRNFFNDYYHMIDAYNYCGEITIPIDDYYSYKDYIPMNGTRDFQKNSFNLKNEVMKNPIISYLARNNDILSKYIDIVMNRERNGEIPFTISIDFKELNDTDFNYLENKKLITARPILSFNTSKLNMYTIDRRIVNRPPYKFIYL